MRTIARRLDAVHPLLLGLVLLSIILLTCVAAWVGLIAALWLYVGPWVLLLPVLGILAVLAVAVYVGPTRVARG